MSEQLAQIHAALTAMHGTLGQVIAALPSLAQAPAPAPAPAAAAANPFGAAPAPAAAAANPFGAAPAPAAAPAVTPQMVQELITPLVGNEQIKAALHAQMQAMGITNLPEARPDQLPELYQRFTTVRDQAQAAGLLQAAAPTGAAPGGII